MASVKIHESEYGMSPLNFHVAKSDDTLVVEITYPPRSAEDNTNDQVRFVEFDQESVRASDGIRIHYDYDRDGYVVEQPKPKLVARLIDGTPCLSHEHDWIEVGFFGAWALDHRETRDGVPEFSDEEELAAEAELAALSPTP